MIFTTHVKIKETSKYTLYSVNYKCLTWIIGVPSILIVFAFMIAGSILGVDQALGVGTKLNDVLVYTFLISSIGVLIWFVPFFISSIVFNRKILSARLKKKKVEEIAEGSFLFPKWEFKIYK